MINRLSLKNFVGVGFAIGAILLTVLMFETSILDDALGIDIFAVLERKGYDVLMQIRGARQQSNDIVLVKIDEYSLDKLGGWPISHDQYGAVMTLMSTYGAKAVALDLIIGESKDERDSIDNATMVGYLSNASGIFNSIGPYIPERSEVGRRDIDAAAVPIVGRFGIPAPQQHTFLRSPFLFQRSQTPGAPLLQCFLEASRVLWSRPKETHLSFRLLATREKQIRG